MAEFAAIQREIGIASPPPARGSMATRVARAKARRACSIAFGQRAKISKPHT
jgi:hypothetical protein